MPGVPPYLLTFHSFAKQNDCQSEPRLINLFELPQLEGTLMCKFFFFCLPTIAAAPGGYGMMSVSPPTLLFLLNTSEGGKDRTCRKTGLSLKSEAQKDLKTLAAGRPSGAALMTTSNKRRERRRPAARCSAR